ncbi:DUF4031 domain-containing protein [Serinibacter arcticus]|uniref:DUF4031 domain-containing protein n=1 Tax=Serinibacter arcticus TaxID=1655435 RepID=A0A2U1ZY59_9MICO|nr:DUF4031 domain-containing protein [Serinibacter arcticus]PWD51911.1 DUF4031 domain-containing protein [Serinibacter arcticus]
MAVLVDPPAWPAHGTLWSHLVSDTSLAELHTFAALAGVPARSFDVDHYDVPASRHAELVARGAAPVSGRDLIRRLVAGGLRHPERRRLAEDAWLREHWAGLATGPSDGSGSVSWEAVGANLLARWSEPGRLHHGRTHLREVLDGVADLALAERAAPRTVRTALLAAWFHDAVHASGRRREAVPVGDALVDDEEASAALALEMLDGDRDAAEVARLVRLTATHEVAPDDRAGALLSDADLAVLGADAPRYADYAAGIRQEYAHVADDVFAPARAAILDRLLEGEVFVTAAAHVRWEARARANLRAEVVALRDRPAGGISGSR